MIVPKASKAFDEDAAFIGSQPISALREKLDASDSATLALNEVLFLAVTAGEPVKDSHFMDVGCFLGHASRTFKEAGAQVTCVDGSQHALSVAKRLGFGNRYIQRNLERDKLPQTKGGYDGIVSSETFKYLKRPQNVLAQIARSLKTDRNAAFSIDTTLQSQTFKHFEHQSAYGKTADIYAHPYEQILATMKANGLDIVHEQELPTSSDFEKKKVTKHLFVVSKLAR